MAAQQTQGNIDLVKPSTETWNHEEQIQELQRRMDILESAGGIGRERPNFKPSPDDILLIVPPKHGTTWLLHICHQIRMKGEEPTFDKQEEVISLLASDSNSFGIDTKQPASPYIYVTHMTFPLVPEGGKKIFCFRDPKDVVVSAYYFMDSYLALNGRVSLPTFADNYLMDVQNQINDLILWWECRNYENFMLIFYDDLKEDHAGSVRRIASFMGVDLDDDAVARVVHTTSHAEMSRIAAKFDVRSRALAISKEIGEEPNGTVDRVRKDGGRSGEGREKLPVEVQQRIDQIWQKIVTFKLGFRNMQEMRKALKVD